MIEEVLFETVYACVYMCVIFLLKKVLIENVKSETMA